VTQQERVFVNCPRRLAMIEKVLDSRRPRHGSRITC
jgi:hypothetical protein